MAEVVAARQPAQAQRADPQRSAGHPERQGAMPARAGIDRLQRALGNRGMARLLRSGAIQAKLAVGPADDEYEREADRVADEVMRMPDPASTVTAQRATLRVQRVRSECEEEAQRSPLPIARACQECEELQPKSSATTLSGPERISRECPECEEKARRRTQEGDAVQRKSDPTDEKDEEEEGIAQAKSRGGDPPEPSSELTSYVASSRGGGQPLPRSTREHFEARFGHDFSGVRVHTDSRSANAAAEINSYAFATGSDIHFGAGRFQPGTPQGDRLLAHELTHTIQQTGGRQLTSAGETAGAVRQRVQRYEAGEHAQLGETQAELTAGLAPASYVVQKGERLSTIAKKFGITVAELKEANKDKLKKWRANDGSGRLIEGFNAGEAVSIPRKLNDLAKTAIKDKSATFTVKGVVLDYGVGIAMGDLYESPEQMAKASPEELKELAALIKREQAGGKVTTEEWQKATGGRYLKLAEKNVAHFAPQNAGLVKPSGAGATSSNHKSEWEKHHATALEASRAGDKDKALMINAFGDHFLTDAFAAGHLINKLDVMEQFKSQLKLDAKSENFTAGSQKFFDDVAKDAFTGGVQTEFSKYETVEFKGVVFRPNINSASRFSQLLQGIHKERPDLLANAVAKGVHDRLNTFPGGLPVENAKGDPPWKLSGDGTLNADTRNVARKAVAQSQLNVISVYNVVGPLDTPSLFKRVWDYTPRPSAAGITQLVDEVKKGTDVNSADLKKAMVNLIQSNYMLIIDELVKLNKLKKA